MRRLGLVLAISCCIAACGDEDKSGGNEEGGDAGSPSGGAAGSTSGGSAGKASAGAAGAASGSGGSEGKASAGSAGTASGSGGSAGKASGGSAGASGGSAGAASGSGGSGPAGAGGSAGGASPSVTVSEVRCFDSVSSGFEYCFGKIGDLWTMVGPPCTPAELDAELTPVTGGPYQNYCAGAADDIGDFQEVRCWSLDGRGVPVCIFRTGDYWIEGFAACNGVFDAAVDLMPATGNDPGALFCGTASGVDGWDEVACYDEIGFGPCYGRQGSYWFGPAYQALWLSGLYPDCYFDEISNDPEWVEIPWAQADCQ